MAFDHVADVRLQRDGGRHQVGTLPDASEGDRMGAMAGADQPLRHIAPAPGAMPCTMNQK